MEQAHALICVPVPEVDNHHPCPPNSAMNPFIRGIKVAVTPDLLSTHSPPL